MAKNKKVDKADDDVDEGVDLSTAAELWSEDELRELIREEALKLIQGGQSQGPFIATPNTPQWVPSYPQWTQTTGGNINTYNDGHVWTVNNAMAAAC